MPQGFLLAFPLFQKFRTPYPICYKFTPEKLNDAQRLLDQGLSQYVTAKAIGVSESAIRYHIKAGSLKKSS